MQVLLKSYIFVIHMARLNTTNPLALHHLLDDTLYGVETKQVQTQKMGNTASFNFLGENKQHILYLVENSQSTYFSAPAQDAFIKTIQALSLSLADVAVLNIYNLSTSFELEHIISFFKPIKLILAGLHPQSIKLPAFPLNTQTVHLGIKILYTHSFEEMLSDNQKKKAFWLAIKTL